MIMKTYLRFYNKQTRLQHILGCKYKSKNLVCFYRKRSDDNKTSPCRIRLDLMKKYQSVRTLSFVTLRFKWNEKSLLKR